MKFQKNYVSQKAYIGKNQAELLVEKESKGYNSDFWLTFIQAREKGLKIKKGAKGVHIFKGFESFTEMKKVNGKDKMVTASRPLGFACVFNLDLTESR